MSIRNLFYKYTYLGMLNLTEKMDNKTAKFFIPQEHGTEIKLVFSMVLRNTRLFQWKIKRFYLKLTLSLEIKDYIFKDDAFKGRSLCVCACTCIILCSRLVCAGVERADSGSVWFCTVYYCLQLTWLLTETEWDEQKGEGH